MGERYDLVIVSSGSMGFAAVLTAKMGKTVVRRAKAREATRGC